MAGYIHRHISREHVLYTLPEVLAQFGSDAVIVKYIAAVRPDIIAFTCFLWNIERSLHIARLVKNTDPRVQVLCGGSEINTGSIAFSARRDCIDYFVIGEGEWFFDRLLRGRDMSDCMTAIGGNRVIVQPDNELVPAPMIVEPFTGRRLAPMLDGSMFFELTRGCPYRCAYCQYSKNYTSIRELPFETLGAALTCGGGNLGLRELYILSPALNRTADFANKLERLAGMKHGIRLHSELRAEGIDAATARLLYRAGFRSMEVGLQTMNREALSAAGRRSSPERELEGMRCLMQAGIDIKIGLMPGLPGDDAASFTRMVDTLIGMGFQENIELYPLMILPGTAIRDHADRGGIRYSRKPPYYYHDGWGMSFDDIRAITRYVEDATGMSHIVRKIPDFTLEDSGLYCRGVRFDGTDDANWDLSAHLRHIETSVFSFYITGAGARTITRCLPGLVRGRPEHVLFNIIFYTNDLLDERALLPAMEEHDRDSLVRRIHIFHDWKDGCAVRYYQVFDRQEGYHAAKASYAVVTPVFHVRSGNRDALGSINEYEDHIVVEKGAYAAVRNGLKKFADSAHTVAFEDEADQEDFYAMTGYEYIRLPFRFRVISR